MSGRKTSMNETRKAFDTWYTAYMEHKDHAARTQELRLIFENNAPEFYSNFMRSRRVKSHSAAFYSVILALKPFLRGGYYASNPQVKKLIEEYFGQPYEVFLADLTAQIEELREEQLGE